jgi:hypothetical protein
MTNKQKDKLLEQTLQDLRFYGGCDVCKYKTQTGATYKERCRFGGCNCDGKPELWRYKHDVPTTEKGFFRTVWAFIDGHFRLWLALGAIACIAVAVPILQARIPATVWLLSTLIYQYGVASGWHKE